MAGCRSCTSYEYCDFEGRCWSDWWKSLTPEEQAAERASMDSYEPDREEMGDPV